MYFNKLLLLQSYFLIFYKKHLFSLYFLPSFMVTLAEQPRKYIGVAKENGKEKHRSQQRFAVDKTFTKSTPPFSQGGRFKRWGVSLHFLGLIIKLFCFTQSAKLTFVQYQQLMRRITDLETLVASLRGRECQCWYY